MLENLVIALQKREESDQDLKDQLAQERTPEMQEKIRECQEAQEQLDLIERKLGKCMYGVNTSDWWCTGNSHSAVLITTILEGYIFLHQKCGGNTFDTIGLFRLQTSNNFIGPRRHRVTLTSDKYSCTLQI